MTNDNAPGCEALVRQARPRGQSASQMLAKKPAELLLLLDASALLSWEIDLEIFTGEEKITSQKDKNSRDRALNIACSRLVPQTGSSIRLAQAANLLLVSTVACWPSVRARSDVTPPVYPECECRCLTSRNTGIFYPLAGLDIIQVCHWARLCLGYLLD